MGRPRGVRIILWDEKGCHAYKSGQATVIPANSVRLAVTEILKPAGLYRLEFQAVTCLVKISIQVARQHRWEQNAITVINVGAVRMIGSLPEVLRTQGSVSRFMLQVLFWVFFLLRVHKHPHEVCLETQTKLSCAGLQHVPNVKTFTHTHTRTHTLTHAKAQICTRLPHEAWGD